MAWLVASDGSTNLYYAAPDAEAAVINFINSTGELVAGHGWITDPGTAAVGPDFIDQEQFVGRTRILASELDELLFDERKAAR